MTMPKEKWEEAKNVWMKVRDQAEIDLAQANLYLQAIDTHLNNHSEEK